MKDKPYIDPATKHFVIDGKRYIIGRTTYKKIGKIKHADKMFLEEIDTKKEDAVISDIVSYIRKGVKLEKVLKQMIKSRLSVGEREKLLKLLTEKKGKFEEQEGCYGWAIGKKYFQLFE